MNDNRSRPFAETFANLWKNDPEFRAAMEEAESVCPKCERAIIIGCRDPECGKWSAESHG